jgi:hypothetical protein
MPKIIVYYTLSDIKELIAKTHYVVADNVNIAYFKDIVFRNILNGEFDTIEDTTTLFQVEEWE